MMTNISACSTYLIAAVVALLGDFAAVVQHPVHRPLGESGPTRNVVDGDLFALCHGGSGCKSAKKKVSVQEKS